MFEETKSKTSFDDMRLRSWSQSLYATIVAITVPIIGGVFLSIFWGSLSTPNILLATIIIGLTTATFVFIALSKKRDERRLIKTAKRSTDLSLMAETFSEPGSSANDPPRSALPR